MTSYDYASRPRHNGFRQIPGRVRGKVLRKKVSVQNRLRKYGDAYALSREKLAEAEAVGAETVELEERETGIKLYAGIRFFRERAVPIHFRGFEPQLALARNLWDIADPAQPSLFPGGTAA